MCRRYTRATGRPKKPAAQRNRQCFNRKIWQLTSPVIEKRPIWLLPCASFRLPPPPLLLVVGYLLKALAARRARKVGKGGAIITGWGFAVRQVRVRLFSASFNPALDGFHRGAMTVLAQILVCVTGAEQDLDHGFFLNPVARDQSAHTKGNRIQPFIAAAFGGAGELGCAAINATRAYFCSRSL